jgi:hypothetical protein
MRDLLLALVLAGCSGGGSGGGAGTGGGEVRPFTAWTVSGLTGALRVGARRLALLAVAHAFQWFGPDTGHPLRRADEEACEESCPRLPARTRCAVTDGACGAAP